MTNPNLTQPATRCDQHQQSHRIPPQDQHQMEEWGSHCSLPSCNMLDFLPFKCPECEKSFCQSHFKPSTVHSDSDHLCEVLLIKSAQQAKLSEEPPRRSTSSNSRPVCSFSRCKTVLVAPIVCPACARAHCPVHRLAPDHLCQSPAPTAAPSRPNLTIPNPFRRSPSTPALKTQPEPKPIQAPLDKNQFSSAPNPLAPFVKIVSRSRAKAEQESQKKALEWRARNGLLTERDKIQQTQLEHSTTSSKHTKNQSRSSTHRPPSSSVTTAKKPLGGSNSDCCIV